MQSIVQEALQHFLQRSIDLWQRKRVGEDMTPHRERFGDVYPMMLRLGSGKIPHDLFLEHGHCLAELEKAIAGRGRGGEGDTEEEGIKT